MNSNISRRLANIFDKLSVILKNQRIDVDTLTFADPVKYEFWLIEVLGIV